MLLRVYKRGASLHGRKLLNELLRDLVEMRENLPSAGDHVRLMVSDIVLLAEAFDEHMDLLQVVARQHGEQMMVHLVLESAAKPVHERIRSHVSRGGDLELPEVRALVSRVHSHAIVSEAEDDGEHEAT